MLRAFVRGAGRGDFHWFFLLVFVFTFLLPTLLRLRPSQTVSLYQSYLNIKLVLGYVGYYVLGYYLKEMCIRDSRRKVLSRASNFPSPPKKEVASSRNPADTASRKTAAVMVLRRFTLLPPQKLK